jgi:site-specific DNA-methyltransferase (adenine-specific)
MIVHCPHDRLVPVKELKAHPQNRNQHPKDQIERLAKILDYQGWRYPIKVSKQSGFITSGHGRLEAAKQLKLKEVPVSFQDYTDEAQEYADLQADNAIASWSELDLSAINTDIGDLGPDFDIDLLGIKDFVIEPADKLEPQCDEDEVPEALPEPKVVRGEVYILGNHRLMCGDSTAITDVERLMDGKKASVWASDPPYGISYVDGVANEKGQAKGYKPIANDELQDEKLKEFIYQSITTSLPFMKKGFAFYMWHAMKMQAYFSQAAAAAAGILFHRQIIWVKPQFVFGRGQYHWRHELCLMGWLQGNEPPFYGERNQSTVWEIGRENDKIHPTQKPIAIWEPSILNHTKPGEIVYEPFAGSGSNLIACEKNSRACYAMELEPAYVGVILDRWQKFTGKKAHREDGKLWDEIKVQ